MIVISPALDGDIDRREPCQEVEVGRRQLPPGLDALGVLGRCDRQPCGGVRQILTFLAFLCQLVVEPTDDLLECSPWLVERRMPNRFGISLTVLVATLRP